MKKITSFLIVIVLVFSTTAKADEGMWLLPLLQKLNIGKITEMGLQLTAEDIYSVNHSSLKDAIVIFGGGCTAEIVSPEGLVLTNHHCGYGSIQSHSTVDHDYLSNGFWAMSQDEELPNPGLSVTFLNYIQDVSDRINNKLNDDMTEAERNMAIRTEMGKIQSEVKTDAFTSARVQPFFNGNQFFLLVYTQYRDVRLVGAPPSAIGKYGADTDNWMWPRHTGDFSVFRVYMSPDGKPANFSEDNVPLNPKHFLPVSVKGVKEGDFTMVMGYPGGTTRYMTSFEIDNVINITNTNRVKIRGIRQDIMLKDMLADPKVRIQYASKYSGSTNYWKFSIGQNQGLKRLKVKDQKLALEKQFTDWIALDPQLQAKYGDALNLIKTNVAAQAPYSNAYQYLSECFTRGTEILGLANQFSMIHSLLDNKETDKAKKMADRIKGNIDRFYKNYNPPTDHKILAAMFKLYATDIPAEFQPDIYILIHKKYKDNYQKFADVLFAKSIFADQNKLNAFLDHPDKKVLDKDLAYKAARSIFTKANEVRRELVKYSSDLSKGRRLWMNGLMAMQKDRVFYPDANFTMRLTYGNVKSYNPKDAVHYNYFTTLKGVMEKEDPNNWEFVVPDKLKTLYKNKDYGIYGDNDVMKVCFITTNDITGGNSGSPVINARGELIGLAFDGNWEAMSGDIAFEPDLQRCICVDVRYVLFIMDKYAGAHRLIDEMTLAY
ncbi:MAG: S46 family peptidase [Bacteroidales bacterium]|nr:S46 family peptidase [Bacteroidales bacterium]